MDPSQPLPGDVPVLIAGGAPVRLTLAALLARNGVRSLVVEADAGYCTGSRAICISRRSQEILWAAGAGPSLQSMALPWTGGRSYWRNEEVLRFEMPSEPTQRFAPMVNIQQYHVEAFVHEAHARRGCGGARGATSAATSTAASSDPACARLIRARSSRYFP